MSNEPIDYFIKDALLDHRDRIDPAAADQVSALLKNELADAPPKFIPELVRNRLGSDAYKRFLKPVEGDRGATKEQQVQTPAPAAGPAPADESKLVEEIRARYAASAGPGLLGYGVRPQPH